MNEEKFPERLKEAARDYNSPPETPRESMWAAIEARREQQRYSEKIARPSFRRLWRLRWPIAAAAVLVLGIGIGRLSLPENPPVTAENGPTPNEHQQSSPENNRAIYQAAAVPVLSKAELLISQYRTGLDIGPNGSGFTARAAELLSDTRLLLDSPAAEDRELQMLLTDLELTLAQILRVSAGDDKEEMEWVNESLKDRALLPRLRTKVSAGKTAMTI